VTDWIALALCGTAWLAYAIYVAQNWDSFVQDMSFAVRWKKKASALDADYWLQTLTAGRLLFWYILAGLVAWGRSYRAPSTRLALVALGLATVPRSPGDWYYEIFGGLAFLFTGLLFLDLAGIAIKRHGANRDGWTRRLAPLAPLVPLILAGGWLGWIEAPVGYPHNMEIAGMRIRSQPSYIDSQDREAVAAYLGNLASREEPVLLRFIPDSDSLLFHDLEGGSLRFIQPTRYATPPDAMIVHYSTLIPRGGLWHKRLIRQNKRKWRPIRARNKKERWVHNFPVEKAGRSD
jgi:hypothetical protein